MQYTLAALALAGLASAQNLGQAHADLAAVRRDIGRALEARQSLPACVTALESIGKTVPTPPADVISFEATQTQTDVCQITLPASLSSEYAVYLSSLTSWAQAHTADLQSALSQCPQYASAYTGFTNTGTYSNPCATNGGGGGGGSGSGGATVTSGSSGSTSTSPSSSGATTAGGSSTSASHNAGPRETGLIAGAIAAAGFVAAVAVAL